MVECPLVSSLSTLLKGCRNECDQKCVIDNHEVEILQHPHGFCYPMSTQSLWQNATSFCTPRGVGTYITPRGGGGLEMNIAGFGQGVPQLSPVFTSNQDYAWQDGQWTDRSNYSVFTTNANNALFANLNNPMASNCSNMNQFGGDDGLPQ